MTGSKSLEYQKIPYRKKPSAKVRKKTISHSLEQTYRIKKLYQNALANLNPK